MFIAACSASHVVWVTMWPVALRTSPHMDMGFSDIRLQHKYACRQKKTHCLLIDRSLIIMVETLAMPYSATDSTGTFSYSVYFIFTYNYLRLD